MEVQSVKVNSKVDFDIILDGKYQKRVSEGILFAKESDALITYVGADKNVMFGALVGLTLFVTENNLEEEFEKFLKNHTKQ